MSILQPELPGARVVDLFAGSGALGIECLSRGAEAVVFVEKAPTSLQFLRENLRALGAGAAATVVPIDALRWVATPHDPPFDLALADPPYGEGYLERLLLQFQERPWARVLWVEHGRGESPPEGIPILDQRRYGDTLLTAVEAEEFSE
jgi:16S rRNA (guanine966-N2)-methyltransferase